MATRPRSTPRLAILAAGLLGSLALAASGCRPPEPRPNVLWVVWDTVRADRLGVYGAPAPTSPQLERWAQGARVFDDCLAPANTTFPSHASMFTGRLPAEHGASNTRPWLDDRHATLAELLRADGYATFLWAANPFLTRTTNIVRGFQVSTHPWDPATRARALELARRKTRGDRASGLADQLRKPRLGAWSLKESGHLARDRLLEWLGAREGDGPWFAFLNYMEAHQPTVPARRHREPVMSAAQIEASYRVDRSFVPMWEYTFGLRELSEGDLAVVRGTYDAALHELDGLFAELLAALDRRGALADTVVILTSDHGEHLGEQHMLDHQYTLHAPALHVPLLIHYPRRLAAGRDPRPVMNFDLFPTLLELTGVDAPGASPSQAVSLLDPPAQRLRLAEYPEAFQQPLDIARRLHPEWDPSPWRRSLRALVDARYKLVWGSDGRHALYDTAIDPGEERDLAARDPDRTRRMLARLDSLLASLERATPERGADWSDEERARLEALGYATEASEPADRAR